MHFSQFISKDTQSGQNWVLLIFDKGQSLRATKCESHDMIKAGIGYSFDEMEKKIMTDKGLNLDR